MNNNIRIQDDLYQYVNKEWIDSHEIPEDLPVCGGFSDIAIAIEKLMINEFKEMSNGNTPIPNDYLKKTISIFNTCLNVDKRNNEGITPLLPSLNFIQSLKSYRDINKQLDRFILEGLPLPFNFEVDANMKDTLNHALYIYGPKTFLPDTKYYQEALAEQYNMLISLFSQMVKGLLASTPLSEEESDELVSKALSFDKRIASFVKSSEEWSEYTKMYNPTPYEKVKKMVSPYKLDDALTKIFNVLPTTAIVTEPRYFKHFKEVVNSSTFNEYQAWAYVNLLVSSSKYLSASLREIGAMFSNALTGVKKVPSFEKQAYYIASDVFSEPVGLYYGKKYFGDEAKHDVEDIVREIIKTYSQRIKDNQVLCDKTKEKAILKLSLMEVKIGYPSTVQKLYDKIVFDENDSLLNIINTVNKIKKVSQFSKLYEPVDRSLYVMPGHMVNACYNPFTNDITFPAAILQAPFYSIKQTRSQNLGGIGAVIGHEISHAFDNNGSNCDEYGNINSWWTKEDFASFKKATNKMVKQFDGLETSVGKVNGKFVVSENIADNGGMAVTLDIMKKMENPNYEEYFKNWGAVWCMKAKPEYLALLLQVDVHSPSVLRANIPPRNFDEWYATFNVKKTDAMYIPKNKRIVIW